MFSESKARWRELRDLAPGERFETFYFRQRERDRGKPWKRVLYLGGAIVAFAIGIVLAVIPGPAVVFFALSAALISTQSRKAARGLDWAELKVRSFATWAAARWRAIKNGRAGPDPKRT